MLAIYRISEGFPSSERFGLTLQLRRAAASIPTNLAEGSKAESPDDFCRYINISEKSLAEAQYLLILHRDRGHLDPADERALQTEAEGIARQLHAYKEAIRRDRNVADWLNRSQGDGVSNARRPVKARPRAAAS